MTAGTALSLLPPVLGTSRRSLPGRAAKAGSPHGTSGRAGDMVERTRGTTGDIRAVTTCSGADGRATRSRAGRQASAPVPTWRALATVAGVSQSAARSAAAPPSMREQRSLFIAQSPTSSLARESDVSPAM